MTGHDAWVARYNPSGQWEAFRLAACVGAFVDGGANFIGALGIERNYALTLVAVLVACFAATTLDTATRLQRYIIQELGAAFGAKPLTNMYAATTVAVGLGLCVAMLPGPDGIMGSGGMILWPLFGATNQLLAGLAFLVTAFYLWRRRRPIGFVVAPMLLMLVMPAWAMLYKMVTDWFYHNRLLFGFGCVIILLQAWMVAEAIVAWPKARGILEKALPPLLAKPQTVSRGGRHS